MFLSKMSINRPVMTTMFILVFILFGLLAFTKMPIDLFPSVNIPYVLVTTVYPGAGPSEVESQVTNIIEDEVSTISGLDNVQSYSMDNVSTIVLKFELTKDPKEANQEVKDKINKIISQLPSDAEQPTIEKIEMDAFPVIDLVLTSNSNSVSAIDLFDIADNTLKNRFAKIEGVARVEVNGGEEREIRVETNNRILKSNNISLAQINNIITMNNYNIAAGFFTNKNNEVSLTTNAEFTSIEELKNLEIPINGGSKKLKEIANVFDGKKEIRSISRFFDNLNQKEYGKMVKISLVKSSDANTVALAQEVSKSLPELQENIPSNVELKLVYDNSVFIQSAVSDTITNLILGVLLTGLVLFLFLHDLRSTFIVALSMPTSIISSFMIMQAMGFSFNMLSLMGLSTAVGVLVSNSIVVLENIFRHKYMGNSNKEAALSGSGEVTTAVIASTATNLVVFLPIAAMSSMAGQFFKEFALTVSIATVFSLIMSFTLTPMLASLILPKEEKLDWFGRIMEKNFRFFEGLYKKALNSLLANRVKPVLFAGFMTLLLIASFMFVAPKLGFEFMPEFDQGDLLINIELPEGADLSKTSQKLAEVEKIVLAHPEVKHIISTIGNNNRTNIATAEIKLVDSEFRNITTSQMNQVFINEVSHITNAKIFCKGSRGEDGDSPIQYYLISPDKEYLDSIVPELNSRMKQIPGLINYNVSLRTGKPQLTLLPKRKEIADAGLTAYDLAMVVRGASEGLTSAVYRENGEEYDIRVTMDDKFVSTPEEIGALIINSPYGQYTVSQLAEVKLTQTTTQITHRDKLPSLIITGEPGTGYPLATVTNKVMEVFESMELEDVDVRAGGNAEMMEETNKDMAQAFLLAIILTYMLLASILENFTQPFLILTTLPMATIGVFTLMYLTGTTMNMFSMMAIIMLIGLVVNDAILILDYTKQLMARDNLSAREALLIACPIKMKPILMTTSAIILGMLPMALGIGSAGKEMRIPMAMVQIGGMATSTMLTLFLIPSLFYLTHAKKKKTK